MIRYKVIAILWWQSKAGISSVVIVECASSPISYLTVLHSHDSVHVQSIFTSLTELVPMKYQLPIAPSTSSWGLFYMSPMYPKYVVNISLCVPGLFCLAWFQCVSAVPCIRLLFILRMNDIPFHIYGTFYSLVDIFRNRTHSYFLASVNNAAVSTSVNVPFQIPDFNSLGPISSKKITRSKNSVLKMNRHQFFSPLFYFIYSSNFRQGTASPSHLYPTLAVSYPTLAMLAALLLVIPILIEESRTSGLGGDLAEWLEMRHLLVICIFSLKKCRFKSFDHFNTIIILLLGYKVLFTGFVCACLHKYVHV